MSYYTGDISQTNSCSYVVSMYMCRSTEYENLDQWAVLINVYATMCVERKHLVPMEQTKNCFYLTHKITVHNKITF